MLHIRLRLLSANKNFLHTYIRTAHNTAHALTAVNLVVKNDAKFNAFLFLKRTMPCVRWTVSWAGDHQLKTIIHLTVESAVASDGYISTCSHCSVSSSSNLHF